jgi:hypothetical protein
MKFLVVGFLALAFLAGASSGEAVKVDNATIKFYNKTPFWMQFSIDGRASAQVPPGDQGSDVISYGQHTLFVKQVNGTLSTSRAVNVVQSEVSWTITYTPPPQK